MKAIYSQNSCKESELLRVNCKKNTMSIDWIYIQNGTSVWKVTNMVNWSWIENLSDSEIYEEKQTRQKRQKTVSSFKEIRESEAIICFK